MYSREITSGKVNEEEIISRVRGAGGEWRAAREGGRAKGKGSRGAESAEDVCLASRA